MTKALAPVQKIPGETREEKAAWLDNVAKRCLMESRGYTLTVAWAFHQMQAEAYFAELGFSSFKEWLVQQEIDMKAEAAYRLIRVYQSFCVVGGFKVEEIAECSISKLDIAQRYMDKVSPKELVAWAKDMTREDLVEHLSEYSNGKKREKPKRSVTCPNCQEEFTV